MSYANPKPEDSVDLVFVTYHNAVYGYFTTRKNASDMMRQWFGARECVRKKEEGWAEAESFLKGHTFAINIGTEEENYAECVVGWEHVIGMYIREHDTMTTQEQSIAVMKDMVDQAKKQNELMRKQVEGDLPGEEWKKNDPEE